MLTYYPTCHKESIYTVYRWYGLIWEVYGAMDEVSGLRGRWRRNSKWSLIGGTTQSCEGSWMNLFLLDPCPCNATLDSRFPNKTVKVFCLNSLLICLRCVCNMSVAREGHSLPTSIPHFLFVPASLRFIDLAGATRPMTCRTLDEADCPPKEQQSCTPKLMLVCLPVPKKRSQGESTWHRRHRFLLLYLWFFLRYCTICIQSPKAQCILIGKTVFWC